MNNDKRTTRENAMLWWNNLGNAEKIKFWNKYPYMIPSFSTRLPKDLTGVEIERLYTAEHPTETESKGQEPEVDLLAHDNYPFGSTAELGSRERSLYEHKKESFIAGYNSLAEQNKLLREALQGFVNNIENHPSFAAREHYKPFMDKAKKALNQ